MVVNCLADISWNMKGLTTVLAWVTLAMMEHHDQKHIEEERGYLAYTYTPTILQKVRTGTQTGWGPGGRICYRGPSEVQLLVCSPWLFHRTQNQRQPTDAFPHYGLGCPTSTTMKMFYRLPYNPVLWRLFSSGVLSYQMTLACVKSTCN